MVWIVKIHIISAINETVIYLMVIIWDKKKMFVVKRIFFFSKLTWKKKNVNRWGIICLIL